MSNVTLNAGGPPINSLALVSVDGVTIAGDGADNPLTVIGGASATAIANAVVGSTGLLAASAGIAGVNHSATGTYIVTLTNPPAVPSHTVPQVTMSSASSSIAPEAVVNLNGTITVHTKDNSATPADLGFFLTVFAIP